MTRKLCLIVSALQAVLFAFILWVSLTDVFEELVAPYSELIFKIISFALILLSPFGWVSLYLSMGFILMWKINAFPSEFKRKIVKGTPVMFFVWKEIRERLSIYETGEDK